MTHRHFKRHRHGFTLIELLVSIAISLVIMTAVVTAYLGSSDATRAAQLQARMNEDAQQALGVLTNQLLQAGNNPAQPNRAAPRQNPIPAATFFPVRGCDDRFTNVTTAASADLLTCGHTGSSTGPGSISIGYEADAYNTVPLLSGVPTDCLGNGLTSVTATVTADDGTVGTVGVFTAENRYYIGTSTAIVNPTLYCKGNGGAAQPIVENIEQLVFSYGTGTPAATTTVAGYLSAFEIENDVATMTDGPKERWSRVNTVRICVVVRSSEPAAPGTGSTRYYDCKGALVASAADQRLRRAFTTTVVLRNR